MLLDALTICITVIGFVLTYKALKKEYKLAIINQKNINAATALEDTLKKAYQLLLIKISLKILALLYWKSIN